MNVSVNASATARIDNVQYFWRTGKWQGHCEP